MHVPRVFVFLLLISIVFVVSAFSGESQEDEDDSAELNQYFPLLSNRKDGKKIKFVCPSTSGKYPHEKDCSLFYECRHGYPHLMKCNRGKLFDEKKTECKDARRVKCKRDRDDGKDKKKDKDSSSDEDSKSKETTTSSSEEVPDEVTIQCPYIWGTFPHPVDCSKYFVCIYKVPTVHQCSSKELYDIKNRKCREKRRVRCGDRLDRDQMKTSKRPTTKTTPIKPEEITTTEVPTTKGIHEFGCLFPNGRYADPTNCSRFYECKSAVPTLEECPESTLYDERKEECREDTLVRCGERPGGVIGDDSSEEKKEKKKEYRCPYTWGLFPSEDDCSKYIICIYNVPTVYNCKKTELFHAKYRRCFPKELVTCDYRINPDDLINPSRTTTLITETTPISTVPSTTTTREATTIPTTTTTPTTTATPITSTTPKTITTTTEPTKVTKPNTPPPTDCEEDDLDCIVDDTGDVAKWFDCPERYGHFPHGSSHQLFIHCDNYRPFVKRCAEDTAFSPKYLVCMWIEKSDQKSHS